MINRHILVALTGSLLYMLPTTSAYAVEYVDTANCAVDADAGGGSNDIQSVSATYRPEDQSIRVELTLCDVPEGKTKYHVRYDHEAPFAPDSDRNGDGVINEDDACIGTWDTRGSFRVKKNKQWGPGLVEYSSNPNSLIFTLLLSDLGANVSEGDTIFLWANTQERGVEDRAPDTDLSDGCGNPELLSEVIALPLTDDDGGNPDSCVCEGLTEAFGDTSTTWDDSFETTFCGEQPGNAIFVSNALGNAISLTPTNLELDVAPTCRVIAGNAIATRTLSTMSEIDACVTSIRNIAANDGVDCQEIDAPE